MQDPALLKTSVFVYHTGRIIFNELTNQAFKCSPEDERLLADLSVAPASLATLSAADPDPRLPERVGRLVNARLLVPASDDETGQFALRRVDIETCRQCNARCLYCPQSVAPKPRGVMPPELFAHILSALGDARPEWVALNHYGEPPRSTRRSGAA
jgi:hypothetical protein